MLETLLGGSMKSKLFYNNICLFDSILSRADSGVFQRLHDVGCSDMMGMQACVFLCLHFFSALISPKVHIGKYSLHKLNLFTLGNNSVKGS